MRVTSPPTNNLEFMDTSLEVSIDVNLPLDATLLPTDVLSIVPPLISTKSLLSLATSVPTVTFTPPVDVPVAVVSPNVNVLLVSFHPIKTLF